MRKYLVILLIGILLLVGCNRATGLEVSKAQARPALQDGNSAVYFTLQNHSAEGDELTGVSSNAAEAAEIHESKMEGDVMQMHHVLSIPIEGKGSLIFEPGGYHIMLIGLKEELKAGDEFQITLQFKNHDDIVVNVAVQEIAP